MSNSSHKSLIVLEQDPRDPAFVGDPYPFYHKARVAGDLFYWPEFDMPAATSFEAVDAVLRDRRFGREAPEAVRMRAPDRLRPFYDIDDNSMLEREPPVHTRLRGQVLRAFTSRRVAGLGPEIEDLTHRLIDDIALMAPAPVDLLSTFAEALPVTIIARMIGLPDSLAPQLLDWSHAMVAMYQARRDREIEDRAVAAATAFSTLIRDELKACRTHPRDDLLSALAANDVLTEAEIIATAILLLNAGHEATVHTIGNGIRALLGSDMDRQAALTPDAVRGTVEEILRYDPPLHIFTRYAMEPVEIFGHSFAAGDQIALILGAANRDPERWLDPDAFDPTRPIQPNASFGAGIHFCLGAPLARLELDIALPILMKRCPEMRLAETPVYADRYHFHGLVRLLVQIGTVRPR